LHEEPNTSLSMFDAMAFVFMNIDEAANKKFCSNFEAFPTSRNPTWSTEYTTRSEVEADPWTN